MAIHQLAVKEGSGFHSILHIECNYMQSQSIIYHMQKMSSLIISVKGTETPSMKGTVRLFHQATFLLTKTE